MELELTPPKELDIEDFVKNYLISRVPEVYREIVDRLRLMKFDNYLNSMDISIKTKTGKKRKISTYEVLYSAFSNLVLKEYNGKYTITINPNTMVANFRLKVITVAELVNYGVMGLTAYPIVDNVFDTVADRVSDYYLEYLTQEVKTSGS